MSKISDKYRKDYKNANFENPRLAYKREKRKLKLKKFTSIIAVILIVVFIYLIFFLPYFQIKQIELNGLQKVNKENIQKIIDDYRAERKWLIFSKNNFWVFDKQDLISAISERYYFENFEIKKRWPNKIILNLDEKESAINWTTSNLCFHLDLTGVAIEYCADNQGLIRIKDLDNQMVKIGERAIEKEKLAYALELNQQIKLLNKVTPQVFEKQGTELNLKTEEGPEIKFNTNLTVSEQVARLALLLDQGELKADFKKVKYIDLRFGEKVYYK